MASSTEPQLSQNHHYTGANHAPPPTPSTLHPNYLSTSNSATADIFSSLLHRLPPTLSLSPRQSPPATCPPIISLSDESNSSLLSASKLGYFQLVGHSISPQLAHSAESDSVCIFNLANDQKQICFPQNWPIGFTVDEDGDDDNGIGESLCLDSSSMSESSQLSLINLREFSGEMEKIGIQVFEMLCGPIGLENPIKKDPTRVRCLTWVHEGCRSDKSVVRSRVYPYIIGLDYQIRKEKYSLLSDSGWFSVLPPVDSVLVTLGDIAQVWSNGKLGKVREKSVENLKNEEKSWGGIKISVLLTLPLDGIVSPQLPKVVANNDDSKGNNDEKLSGDLNEIEERKYMSFAFEDYAWRVYHQRVFLKDPLSRYRIKAL